MYLTHENLILLNTTLYITSLTPIFTMGVLYSTFKRYEASNLLGKRVINDISELPLEYNKEDFVYRKDLLKHRVIIMELDGIYNMVLHLGRIYVYLNRDNIIVETMIDGKYTKSK